MSRPSQPKPISTTSILSLVLLFMLCTGIKSFGQKTFRDSLRNELQRTETRLKSNLADTTHINSLNALAIAMRYVKPDSLDLLAEKALKLSTSIEYKKGKIIALNGKGDYLSDNGNHDLSISFYTKALQLSKEIKNDYLELSSMNRLASEYQYQGKIEVALNEMLIGLEKADSLGVREMQSIYNEKIGMLYANQNDFEEALTYLTKSKKIGDLIKDETRTAYTMANLASVYADAEKYEYAMFHINSCIATLEKKGIKDRLAFAYEIKGKIYLNQEKFKWASYWYDQSKVLHEKSVEHTRGEINLLNSLAEVHLGLKKDSMSNEYAIQAYKLAKRLKSKNGLKNSSKTLYKINKQKNDFQKALSYHETFQRLSETLSLKKGEKSLLMLKTKMGHIRQKEQLIADNKKALARQKNYIFATLGILFVLVVIIFLIKRNEKIQKRLNKELHASKSELESHEIELIELNNTKDRLFSIIGHDLRGPIGAFQGLIQMYTKGEVTKTEFLEFIPRLKTDIEHIFFTMNNLLSWGYNQMKGGSTNPEKTSLMNLVDDSLHLLEETANKKSIKLVNRVTPDFVVWSDKNQIDVVIRNLISNALKFTPENGMVTVEAKALGDKIEVSVRDTGIGMDKETREKIFTKNANITTYGTNNEKGTGLGLTLCKEMVENNQGEIWVESAPKIGTSFFFTLPKAKKETASIKHAS